MTPIPFDVQKVKVGTFVVLFYQCKGEKKTDLDQVIAVSGPDKDGLLEHELRYNEPDRSIYQFYIPLDEIPFFD
jgi:hypothetical protein